MVRSNDQRMAAATAESAALTESTARNLMIALIVSILATGGALFMAHRVVKRSIVDPLLELDGQMRVLARGDHKIVIRHVDRKDEVGTMSRSVAVFRDQAEERARLEEEKKQADAEQEHVVKTLGSYLDWLAAGDVTAEISEHFPHSYWQLRMAYNAALRSLSELIASVSTAPPRSAPAAARSRRRARISPGGRRAMPPAWSRPAPPSCRWTAASRPPPSPPLRRSAGPIRRSPP